MLFGTIFCVMAAMPVRGRKISLRLGKILVRVRACFLYSIICISGHAVTIGDVVIVLVMQWRSVSVMQ